MSKRNWSLFVLASLLSAIPAAAWADEGASALHSNAKDAERRELASLISHPTLGETRKLRETQASGRLARPDWGRRSPAVLSESIRVDSAQE